MEFAHISGARPFDEFKLTTDLNSDFVLEDKWLELDTECETIIFDRAKKLASKVTTYLEQEGVSIRRSGL